MTISTIRLLNAPHPSAYETLPSPSESKRLMCELMNSCRVASCSREREAGMGGMGGVGEGGVGRGEGYNHLLGRRVVALGHVHRRGDLLKVEEACGRHIRAHLGAAA